MGMETTMSMSMSVGLRLPTAVNHNHHHHQSSVLGVSQSQSLGLLCPPRISSPSPLFPVQTKVGTGREGRYTRLHSRVRKKVKLPEGKKYVILSFQNNHHPSPKTITAPLPPKPPKIPEMPSMSSSSPPPTESHSDFQEKLLYLDSNGLDILSLIQHHPPIITTCLDDLKSTIDFLTSTNFTAFELRRIFSMCPEILTSKSTALLPVFTFLLREAGVNGSDLKRVINRRPRLLTCNVEAQLRPTLYFLQNIGISEVKKHSSLLSCSVENKLIPRIEYFQKIGFSYKQSISMFRRFPQLFNYSVKGNYEPKLNYFVVEMGRDLKEIKEFPQYFSFSLEKRIKPRHQRCIEKGACFPLPVLLKTSDVELRNRLEVCCNSTLPLKGSPLWCTENCDIE